MPAKRLADTPTIGLADIGVTGLAVMGRNLARNLAHHGHAVALHNRSYARTQDLVDKHGGEGTFLPSESIEDFVASLSKPRAIIIMVKAGDPTDAVIDELVPLLDQGDIVIDCGNAHFTDTLRREQALKEQALNFVGTGVSGGEEGALNGPSIMPGGSDEAYVKLGPDLRVDLGPRRRRALLRARRPGRAPATSSRWCTTASSTPTCSSSPRPTTCCASGWAHPPPRSPKSSRSGTRATSSPSSSRSPRRCSPTSTPPPARPFVDIVRRPGRAEGHRPLDRAERARPRRADHRDRGGHLRARPVRRREAARRPPQGVLPGHDAPRAGAPIATPSSTTSARRSTPRRWWRTRKASTRSPPPARSSAGTSTAARWHGSGAAAASSGPASSTASPRRTSATSTCRCCSADAYFTDILGKAAAVVAPGGRGRRAGRRADPGVLLVARLLRRGTRRAAARCPHPGTARLLRRAHLPPHRPRRHLPHALVGRPSRDRGLTRCRPESPTCSVSTSRSSRRRWATSPAPSSPQRSPMPAAWASWRPPPAASIRCQARVREDARPHRQAVGRQHRGAARSAMPTPSRRPSISSSTTTCAS